MHSQSTDPSPDPRDRRPLVRAARTFLRYYLGAYHSIDVKTPCTLPPGGNAILVSNHISGLDPFVIQEFSPRLVTWMMAREYYDIPLLRWVFKAIEAIPVDRSGRDLAATRSALRQLAAGRILGIFPEGRIAPGGQILPFQTGVALLAITSRAPVYPVYIEGGMRDLPMRQAFLLPASAIIAFGPAVDFDRSGTSRQAIDSATVKIHAAVAALRDRYSAAPG